MTVKTGRHIVRRDGQVVDAEASWKIGPAVSSSSITGASASATWGRPELVSVMETDHTDHAYDGHSVEIDWQDADGTTRVFTGRVQSTSGGSLELPQSQLTDGTDRLSRKLDLRPMAYTLPVHPINAGHGGRKRHVGLHGIWFTHQAMVAAGYDPGVPMHWSSVWYQSMCGSVATVPDADHAYASRGDLRTAYRTTNPDAAPGFVQDENQVVAEDVYTFGVTSRPRPGTEALPWQLTWDLPIVGGIDGELVLRNLDTSAGLAVKWSTNNMSFYKHNETGTQELLGTVVRDRNLETGDKRWSIIASPSGSTVIVRTDARGEVARWEGAGTVHPLPTGEDGLCTLRTDSPGRIGTTAITRGDRHYMTTEPSKGKIMRHSLVGTSLPGWPSMPDQEAGRILTDQADAHRGLRGQPLWSWVDHNGLLVNTDFDTLAARPVVHEFDTRPDSGALGLDGLTWGTDIPGAPFSKVQVTALRMSMSLRDRPTLLLSEGVAQGLSNGDDYVEFLNAESGTTWFEPDLRPLMAGWPYPSPPYDPRYKNNLNREEKSWVGGHRFLRESGERRGWLHPYQLSWTVDAAGHVVNAMRQITPETVIVEGTAVLPEGQWPQDASTAPDPGSQGLNQRRKEQPFPQLRGYGLGRELEMSVDFPIGDADARHSPLTHDCGWWIQSNTGLTAIGSAMLEQVSRPTPTRSAKVEQSGWVKAGEKVLLRERRRNGYVIEEEIVVTPVEGETNSSDDSMTITGIVTARRVVQTDPDAPPVDEEEEWVTPPPTVPPAPPRDTVPPKREDDPGDPGDPPGAGPVKPSTPTLTYDPHGLLVVTWDGQNAAGGSAVTGYFGSAEVALAKIASPDEVIGLMVAQEDGTFLFSEPSVDYGTQWYTRIRVVDRWGRVSEWSDAAGPAEVVPLVDPEQFDDLRELLDQTRTEIAESGVVLDGKLADMEQDIADAEAALAQAQNDIDAAEQEINAASVWIANTGAELGTNLAQAQDDITDAENRLTLAEQTLGNAVNEIEDASTWITTSGVQLDTMLGGPDAIPEQAVNKLWAGVVRSRKITTDMLIVGSGENMLPWNPAGGVEPHSGINGSTLTTTNDADLGWVYSSDGAGVTPGTWTAIAAFRPDTPSRNGRAGSFDVVPGESIRIRVGVGLGGAYPAGTPIKRVFVQFRTQTQSTAGSYVGAITAAGSFDSTQEYVEGLFLVPGDAATMDVYVQANNPGTCFFYNGSVKRASDSSLIVDGAVTAKKITITGDENNPDEAGLVANIASIMELDVGNLVAVKGTIDTGVVNELWTKVVRSQKITTDMLIVGRGENIWPDPWFQQEEAWVNAGVGITDDPSAPGGRRLSFGTTGQGGGTNDLTYYMSHAYRGLSVEPGGVYRVSLKAIRGGSAPHPDTLRVYARGDIKGGGSAVSYVNLDLAGITYSWDNTPTFSGDLTIPEDWTGGATLGLMRMGGPYEASALRVADVRVIRKASSSLIVDGAITAKKITITGDENNPDEAGLVANIASIMELDVENLVVTGSSSLNEAVIDKLWTDVVRSQKITTDMLLVGSGVNLVVDPGFTDTTLTNWRVAQSTGPWSVAAASGGYPRRVVASASTTQSSFRLYSSAGSWYEPVEPGAVYRIKYQAHRGTGVASTRPAVRFIRKDGTVAYTAVDQSAYVPVTASPAWYEFTWTAPHNAVEAAFDIQTGPDQTADAAFYLPSVTVSGASLIVDGSIAARHADLESIGAEIGEFVYIEANHIKAGTLDATIALAGEVILTSTNGRIATAATGSRVEMKGNSLSSYANFTERTRVDSTGLKVFSALGTSTVLSATASGVDMVGSLTTGSGANGVAVIPSGSYWGDGAVEFRHSTFTAAQRPVIFADHESAFGASLKIKGPGLLDGIRLSETGFYVGPTGRIDMEAGSAGMLLRSDGEATFRARASAFNNQWNELKMESASTGATFLTGVGWGSTTTNTANTHAALDGRIRRSTSLSKHKLAQEDFTDLEAIKALRPVTWFDRADSEAYAEALWSGDEEALKGIGQLRRQVGLIAEDVAKVAPILANYDNDGSLFGVSYERVASASLLWHQESDRRHDATEAEIKALREELDALRS